MLLWQLHICAVFSLCVCVCVECNSDSSNNSALHSIGKAIYLRWYQTFSLDELIYCNYNDEGPETKRLSTQVH